MQRARFESRTSSFGTRARLGSSLVLVVLVVLGGACANTGGRSRPSGSDSGTTRPDAATSFDGGPIATVDGSVDGGDVTVDGGGETRVDGAMMSIDAGPGTDAGPGIDAGPRVDAGTDAGPRVDAGPAPECTRDAECGAGRRCLTEICRDECTLGLWCGTASSGSICQSGACVECRADSDCASGRERCDTARYTCVERPVDTSLTSFGIFYSTWHCIAANARPIRDISEVLAGRQSWGAYGEFHWWDQPSDGYYCLSNDDALLREHAELLRDAGIDFVFLDATNHAYVDARSHDTPGMILRPLDRLLAVWSTITGAPKIVPWVPVVEAGENASVFTVDAINARLASYPGMHFEYLGKPLVMITENEQYVVNASREAAMAARYTTRRMWGALPDGGTRWSFMQRCDGSPTSSAACGQRLSPGPSGGIEQIPVSVAYQQNFMNNTRTATPKHRGITFRKQFQAAFDHPETPIVTITGWNEWIAQRQRCDSHPTCPCSEFPDGCFLDQWDVEFSRDIEPGMNAMGDYYYRLMSACISLFRSGARCDAAHASDLCCRDYSP